MKKHSRFLCATVACAAALFAVPGAASAANGAPAIGAGAAVPFTEYAGATQGATNGTVLPVGYQYGSLQAEATGRQAVQLTGQGQYVSFTLTRAANAVDFHYAIPDSLQGGGITAPLDMYVDGKLATPLSLTSEYSWLYGTYPYTNTPFVAQPDGEVPHDYYNDVRYQFPHVLQAGSVVTLKVDAGDNAPWYAIDTADFETVGAPIPQPATGYLDVTQAPYNIDDTGATDVTTALQNAINTASAAGEGVYLPQGTYTISSPLNVSKVKILGAGEWYTVLTGTNVEFNGQQNPASTSVDVRTSPCSATSAYEKTATPRSPRSTAASATRASRTCGSRTRRSASGSPARARISRSQPAHPGHDGRRHQPRRLRRTGHGHDGREQLPAQHPGRRDRAVVAALRRHGRHDRPQHRRFSGTGQQYRRVRRGRRRHDRRQPAAGHRPVRPGHRRRAEVRLGPDVGDAENRR